jgi:hypothetical protein
MLVPTDTEIINMIKNGNPQQLVMGMLQQKANQNPMFANILNLVQAGDTQGVENIVRNMFTEKGMDFDKEFNSFKRKFGFKL